MNDYGIMLAAAALLSTGLFIVLLPRGKRYAGPLTAALCALLGLMLARLVFWLSNAPLYLGQLGDVSSLVRVNEGGLSMTGALLGMGLGCFLSSRILRDPSLPFSVLADALAPAAALFIACERCHEWTLLQQNYGLDVSTLHFFSVQGAYSPVLNAGRIASLTALGILIVLLALKGRRRGDKALLFLFLCRYMTERDLKRKYL